MNRPVTIQDLHAMKAEGQRFAALTAYDYTSARIVDAAEVPLILVGDSLGMVVLGHETTVPVTLTEMVHHTKAVVRGARRALVVADLPFLTYQISTEQAMENAGRLMTETGCKAVKLEGGLEIAGSVRRIVQAGIPVLGHIGYTPQSAHLFGRSRVQGKTVESGIKLVRDALALQAAGAFAVVLELVPRQLAREVTTRLRIPTIGIGSGVHCDAEIQVFHDVFGLYTDFSPRHSKRFADLSRTIGDATREYAAQVGDGRFPGLTQSVGMEPEVMGTIRARLDQEDDAPPSAVAIL